MMRIQLRPAAHEVALQGLVAMQDRKMTSMNSRPALSRVAPCCSPQGLVAMQDRKMTSMNSRPAIAERNSRMLPRNDWAIC